MDLVYDLGGEAKCMASHFSFWMSIIFGYFGDIPTHFFLEKLRIAIDMECRHFLLE